MNRSFEASSHPHQTKRQVQLLCTHQVLRRNIDIHRSNLQILRSKAATLDNIVPPLGGSRAEFGVTVTIGTVRPILLIRVAGHSRGLATADLVDGREAGA